MADCRSRRGERVKNIPEGRGLPPAGATSHPLKLFDNDGCIATSVVEFLFCFEQILPQIVVVRMDELVDTFGGLLVYRAVGVDVHIGGLGKIRNPAWARVAAPRGGVSRS